MPGAQPPWASGTAKPGGEEGLAEGRRGLRPTTAARRAAGGMLTFLVSLRLISYLSSRRSASSLAAEGRDIP